jgi:RNA polymerase sigma-70 factor, ECF subfamily
MPPDSSFQSVLRAAQAGAEWALAELYREIHPPLLRYLRAQDSHEADDLASQTWLDVARGIGSFDGDNAAFRSWVFTIGRRRLIDLRRARTRRRTVSVPVQLLDACRPEPLPAAESEGVLPYLSALPPEQAEIVLLRIVGGFDSNQVAAITGKKPGTVRVIQKRALARLAELVDDDVTMFVTQ